MSKKAQVVNWIKEHKKELQLAGVGLGVVGLAVFISNRSKRGDTARALLGHSNNWSLYFEGEDLTLDDVIELIKSGEYDYWRVI